MASVAKPILNTLSMATNSCCIVSLPSLFSKNSTSFSIPSKPIKLTISSHSSHSILASFLSLKRAKDSKFGALLSAVAEEDNTVALAEEEEIEFDGEEEVSEEEQVSEEESEGGFEGFEGTVAEVDEEPSEEAKLYVGNLPYDVDYNQLAAIFLQAGVVETAEVIMNRETDTSRGFGFVTMQTVEEAEKAIEMFHRYEIGGRLLTVNKAAPRGSRAERPPRVFETSSRIYVGNLPWDVDDSRLEQVFSEHGKVLSARVITDRDSGRSKGFGFVAMASVEEMNEAIANLDGQNLDGRNIKVNVAEERPPRRY